MTRFFVTGGAGFIGTALCLRLASAGHSVTSFDNCLPQVHMPGFPTIAQLKTAGVATVEGDIRDRAALEAALRSSAPDVIFHFASETGTGQSFGEPARYTDVNVTGTAVLVEAVRQAAPGVRRVVLAGTRAVYGEGAYASACGDPVTAVSRARSDLDSGVYDVMGSNGVPLTPLPCRADLCPPNPASIYASTKLMQEHLLTQGFWGSETAVTVLRLQNVYGPGQSSRNPYTGVLSAFAEVISEGRVPTVFEDGDITRDFVFIDDVARALEMTGEITAEAPQILDLGSGHGTTIMKAARHLMHLAGKDPARVTPNGYFRPGDVRHAVADVSVTRAALGWSPATPLEEGLFQLWNWHQRARDIGLVAGE